MNQKLTLLGVVFLCSMHSFAQELGFYPMPHSWFHPEKQWRLQKNNKSITGITVFNIPTLDYAGKLDLMHFRSMGKGDYSIGATVGMEQLGSLRRYSACLLVGRWFGKQIQAGMQWQVGYAGLPVYGYQSFLHFTPELIWKKTNWIISASLHLQSENKWKSIAYFSHIQYQLSSSLAIELLVGQESEGQSMHCLYFNYTRHAHQFLMGFRNGMGCTLLWQSSARHWQWSLGLHYHPVYNLYPESSLFYAG